MIEILGKIGFIVCVVGIFLLFYLQEWLWKKNEQG